jgi:hypothetical protein
MKMQIVKICKDTFRQNQVVVGRRCESVGPANDGMKQENRIGSSSRRFS